MNKKYETSELIKFLKEIEEDMILEWGDIIEEEKLKFKEIKSKLLELEKTKRNRMSKENELEEQFKKEGENKDGRKEETKGDLDRHGELSESRE